MESQTIYLKYATNVNMTYKTCVKLVGKKLKYVPSLQGKNIGLLKILLNIAKEDYLL
jgi:hypothetical protein